MNTFIKFLHFIFSSFWIWLGFTILLIIVLEFIGNLINIILQYALKRKSILYDNNEDDDSEEDPEDDSSYSYIDSEGYKYRNIDRNLNLITDDKDSNLSK